MTEQRPEQPSQKTGPQSARPSPVTTARTTDGQASYGELVDRLRSIEGVNDNFAEAIARNWQRVLGALVVVLIGAWLVQKFRESQQEKMNDAAQTFVEASQGYAIFAGSSPEQASAEKNWAFQPKLESLITSYGDSSYGHLSQMLLARADLTRGNHKAAQERLKKNFDIQAFSPDKPLDNRVFLDELAALLYAKSLFSEAATKQTGQELLLKLAENARLVNVEALLALLRTAQGETELNQVTALAETLKTKRPELASLINRELSTRGMQSGDDIRPVDD